MHYNNRKIVKRNFESYSGYSMTTNLLSRRIPQQTQLDTHSGSHLPRLYTCHYSNMGFPYNHLCLQSRYPLRNLKEIVSCVYECEEEKCEREREGGREGERERGRERERERGREEGREEGRERERENTPGTQKHLKSPIKARQFPELRQGANLQASTSHSHFVPGRGKNIMSFLRH